MKETVDNFRLGISLLGSGWAAVLYCDVTDEHGTYTDVQQTGFGRYKDPKDAHREALAWSESDEHPYTKPEWLEDE